MVLAMTDRRSTRRTSPLIVWPVCLFFIVAFYFANLGAVIWLAGNGHISTEMYESIRGTVYWPVAWISSKTDFFETNPLGRTYIRYLHLFPHPLPRH